MTFAKAMNKFNDSCHCVFIARGKPMNSREPDYFLFQYRVLMIF